MVDLQTEFECRELATRFLKALDTRQYDSLSAMFAEDGVWERHNEKLVGPKGVRAAMAKRPVDLETQHVMSNLTVDAEGGLMVARYTMSAYATTGNKPAKLNNIFLGEDHMRKTAEGWRFVQKTVTVAFAAFA